MSNFTKSIVYSGVVLAVGLLAIFAIRSNMEQGAGLPGLEPAAGEYNTMSSGDAAKPSDALTQGTTDQPATAQPASASSDQSAVPPASPSTPDAATATDAAQDAASSAGQATNAAAKAQDAAMDAQKAAQTAKDAADSANGAQPSGGGDMAPSTGSAPDMASPSSTAPATDEDSQSAQ